MKHSIYELAEAFRQGWELGFLEGMNEGMPEVKVTTREEAWLQYVAKLSKDN